MHFTESELRAQRESALRSERDHAEASLEEALEQLAEARALLREANCTDEGCLEEQASSRVYGHKTLYVCDWCQRRRALLGEE